MHIMPMTTASSYKSEFWLTGSQDGTIKVWHSKHWDLLRTFISHSSSIVKDLQIINLAELYGIILYRPFCKERLIALYLTVIFCTKKELPLSVSFHDHRAKTERVNYKKGEKIA